MARSFSNAKVLSALVVEQFSSTIFRRGYAAGTVAAGKASQGAAAVLTKKVGGEERVGSTQKVPWVPDPKTGYYRPETEANEIDPAELRAALLNNNNKKH